ncbi:Oidioi.mRNA.OKI2018_I69.chr2.g4486.t1.cds [Oikopleura dioica]|uniref:Oidioi.mRNA.OKI2018_I69.chr2.g4486.t1.cds n=1 Tax=Oikopleura dioica TaxID=34765 RepID=A0ABN7SXX0_OIKDI|nr:Oidioi.mRNA.OKI2018_I69.chr2.g4486.t1.cds [Oikopleura dioica]
MKVFFMFFFALGYSFSVHDFCPKVCVACSPHLLGKRSVDMDELMKSEINEEDPQERISKRGWLDFSDHKDMISSEKVTTMSPSGTKSTNQKSKCIDGAKPVPTIVACKKLKRGIKPSSAVVSFFFYGTDEVDPRRKRSKETLLPLEMDVKVKINGENWFGIAFGKPASFNKARSECAKRNMSIPAESFEIVDFYPERPLKEHHLDRIWWIDPLFYNDDSISSETQRRVDGLIKEQESKDFGIMILPRTDGEI